VFPGFEVLRLDGFLRCLDPARDHSRLDRHALFHAEPLEEGRDPLLGEDTHEVVFEREVETRGARVALASRTATELIVDTAGFMAFRSKNVETAYIHDFLMFLIGRRLMLAERFFPLGFGDHILAAL